MIDTDLSMERIVVVSGPSGAGRSSALNVLEDSGFETVDNLPLRLLPALMETASRDRPLALGIDPRNRDFSTNGVLEALAQITALTGIEPELLYLDCASEVLLRRFSETRRRHPLARDDRLADGIMRELDLLGPLKARADVLIDTSDMNIHQFRAEVEKWFAPDGQRTLSVSVQSFSYKRGLPRAVDTVFDCRFLRNPYWVERLRPLNGLDDAVAQYVKADARFDAFARHVLDLGLLLLPAHREEGKSYLSIAFGCTGGQHRSVVVAQTFAFSLAEHGWQVSIKHRELDLRRNNEV